MAGKKKQIKVPRTTTFGFVGMSKKELREWCKTYYLKNFIGRIVKNQDMGIDISFKRLGNKKTSYGAAMYPKKAAAKRAENIPARDNNEFNRFYPANKTLCKYTSFFAFRNCFSHENNIKRLSAFFISISSTLYWMNFFLSHFIARSI